MRLYHGTAAEGLDVLCANSCDRNGDPVLYLTDNRAYSLFYIRDRDIDFVTCGVGTDGAVHYDEKIPHQLKVLYQGKSGYIYEVEADAKPTNVNGIYVISQSVQIVKREYIPDVYDAVCAEIDKGNVDLVRYEELTEEQRRLNEEGMYRWFLAEQGMHPAKRAFLQTHFPEAWVRAQKTLAQMK